MTLIVCWFIFPAVLGALSLGCGLLLERISGVQLPGALLLPAGLAVLSTVALFATATDATAELATPAVIVVAVAGAVLSLPWRRGGLDGWALGCAAGVFAVFAAPVVLSGEATWAGYLRFDDTAFWFGITDHVMEHGRNLDGLAPSFYQEQLARNLDNGYPIGSFVALGVGRALVGQDVAWVFQPYLAFLAAMLGLSLYGLGARVIEPRAPRALAAFAASQSALLFGFALVGGIKELTAAWLLALLAALVPVCLRAGAGPRSMLPLAVASAGVLGAISFGGALWLLPVLGGACAWAFQVRGRSGAIRLALAFSALLVVLSIPALVTVDYLGRVSDVLTGAGAERGFLRDGLHPLQLFGIWFQGDFRFEPDAPVLTYFLIVLVMVAGAAGVFRAWTRANWELPLYVGGLGVGLIVIAVAGGPWLDAKALATASPAFLFAAAAGVFALFEDVDREEAQPVAVAVAVAIVGGVLWSNLLAYHGVNLAPRDRFAELERVGERVDGKGPTLTMQFDLYDVMHFLRKGDPDGPWRVPKVRGGSAREAQSTDIDELRLDGVLARRSLVLARSPTVSRPPSPYRLALRGSFYDLWQREEPPPRVLEHLSLGDSSKQRPIARPNCGQVLRLAQRPETRRLASVTRPPPFIVELARLPHPQNWLPVPGDPEVLAPVGPGTMPPFQFRVARTASGRYGFWFGKAFRRRLELLVDGNVIGARTHELQPPTQFTPMGTATLAPGLHTLALRYGGSSLRPGADLEPAIQFGPLSLSQIPLDRPVRFLRPSQARSLCGERLDWVEALGS